MTDNSRSHPTPDEEDADDLDTRVNLESALRAEPRRYAPRHGARVAAAGGGKTSPVLLGVGSLFGFLIGAGVYGFAQSAHSKEHTPAAKIMRLPVAAKAAEVPKAEPTAAKKEAAAVAPEATSAAPSASEDDGPPESQMFETARDQLSSGDAAAALTSLEHMRKRFPKGSLAQERELLRIEALKAKGQRAAAKTAARKFAKAHPNNPRLSELESLLIGP